MNFKKHVGKYAVLLLGTMMVSLAAAEHNVLSPKEVAAGYKQLFNGKDFTGWRSWNSMSAPASWNIVAESTYKVLNIQNGDGTNGHLVTVDSTLQNFDLKVEWAVVVGSNSGIFIRYVFHPKTGSSNSWGGMFGPESQVVDVTNNDGNSPLHEAGDAYDLLPVTPARHGWAFNGSKVAGKDNYRYNQFRMIVFNKHVAHYGNGHKLLEYEIDGPIWKDAYDHSKYKQRGAVLYGDVHPGAIYIQNHGQTQVHYRDLRAKNLSTDPKMDPWAVGSPYLKDPANPKSGLLDDLTFDDVVDFAPTGLQPLPGAANGLRAVPMSQGLDLSFGQSGNFTISVEDLQGRATYRKTVVNQSHILLPSRDIGHGSRVLRVTSGNTKIHSDVIVLP